QRLLPNCFLSSKSKLVRLFVPAIFLLSKKKESFLTSFSSSGKFFHMSPICFEKSAGFMSWMFARCSLQKYKNAEMAFLGPFTRYLRSSNVRTDLFSGSWLAMSECLLVPLFQFRGINKANVAPRFSFLLKRLICHVLVELGNGAVTFLPGRIFVLN